MTMNLGKSRERLGRANRYLMMGLLGVSSLWSFCGPPTWGKEAIYPTAVNTEPTPLDRYVAAPDESYQWKVVATAQVDGGTVYTLDMQSQTWLRPDEVNRPVWQHWVNVVVPTGAKSDVALLFVGGGGNGGGPPRGVDPRVAAIAKGVGTVVVELKMVPNQPLIFHNDGVERKEDDLIGYTWDQYIKTGDARWPARLPMVKSVVRAMDTVQALMERESAKGGPRIAKFVVAGGSKRGWTTWVTAAVDRRVVAIAPIVIDVLNTDLSMQHHFAAYGFWAPAIGNYVQHKIPDRRHWARYRELMQIEDPFAYRDRYTMPKCVINATGDQFFLPDSSQFYFDELPGEKHLCYVPNGDHSLEGTNALDTLIAFHYCIVHDVPRPEIAWTFPDGRSLEVTTKTKPVRVLHWQATNPQARDFRVETLGRKFTSQEIAETAPGVYRIEQAQPPAGWSAFFLQLEFDVGAPVPLRITSPVRVIPDVLPFADRESPVIPEPQ